MDRVEILKEKQKAALLVVLSLGLLAVPVSLNWQSNIFAGTSFDQGPLHLFFKILSFLFLTALFAIPAFLIYLLVLIITSVELLTIN